MADQSKKLLSLRLWELSASNRSTVMATCRVDDEQCRVWAQKIARFANLQRNGIKKYCRYHLSGEKRPFLTFCISLLEQHLQTCKDDLLHWHQMINALCWLDRATGHQNRAGIWIDLLATQLKSCNQPKPPIETVEELGYQHRKPRKISVVFFAPSNRSLYTQLVLAMCLHHGIHVSAILTKAITPRRILEEMSRLGLRALISKIMTKFLHFPVSEEHKNSLDIKTTAQALIKDIGLTDKSLVSLANQRNIPIITVPSFSAANTFLRENPNHLGVFTGGGMLQASTLSACGIGILNVHSGLLPRYKGMGVIEAPLLEGRAWQTGMTSHFMEPGVDTGPMFDRWSLDIRGSSSLKQAQATFEAFMPLLMMQTVLRVARGDIPQPQSQEGQQYFQPHPKLRALAEACLSVKSTNPLQELHAAHILNLRAILTPPHTK